MHFVNWGLVAAFLSLGSMAFGAGNAEIDSGTAGISGAADTQADSLSAEQLAAIDAEIEQLNLTHAQAIDATNTEKAVGRAPAVMAVPEVDSGLDQGE